MAITIERKVLVDGLQIIKDNIVPTELSDASNYVILQNGRLHGYSDSVGITVPLNVDGVPNCAVEMQLLYDFLRKMNDKEILIGLHEGNLKLKGKNAVAEIAIRTDITYPETLIVLDENKFTRLPETFSAALTFTGFACDPEQSAYSRVAIFNGTAYGLSERRAASFFMGDGAKELFPSVTFVSPECLGFVNKLNPKKYLISDGWFHLIDSTFKIYSTRTRADNRFPFELAEELLADSGEEVFRLPPDFANVLERANPFSGKTAKVRRVSLDIRDNRLDLVATREDGSCYKERCVGVKTQAPLNFTVNLRLLSDVIKLAEKYQISSNKLVATAPFFRAMCPLESE